MAKTQDVVLLVGSLRKDSINRKVANALIELAPESLTLATIEIGQLPIYNQDRDENPPAEWTVFRERIRAPTRFFSSRLSIIARCRLHSRTRSMSAHDPMARMHGAASLARS